MYKPKSLDDERSSWRTVVYFNVVRSIKHLLTSLETWESSLDEAGESTRAASVSVSVDVSIYTELNKYLP